MGTKPKNDKAASLEQSGTLNTKPGRVKDELFTEEDFFDSKDLLQVKYEMLRRVDREKWPISKASRKFGFSRPAFYEAKRSFDADGLVGLIPKQRGPKSPHKLTDEILDFIAVLGSDAGNAEQTAALIKQRFEIDVHPRSIARAIEARGKKKHSTTRDKCMASNKILCDRYEALRVDALAMLSNSNARSFGLALLCNRGIAAWIEAWSEIASPPAKSPTTATQVEVLDHIPVDIKSQLASLIAQTAVQIQKEAV